MVFKQGWECRNDHTIVAVKAKVEAAKIIGTETNWHKVTVWMEAQEEYPGDEGRSEFIGDPYRELRE